MKFTAQCIHNIGQQDGIKLVLLQECRPLGLLGCVPCKGVSQPEGHRDWHGHLRRSKVALIARRTSTESSVGSSSSTHKSK